MLFILIGKYRFFESNAPVDTERWIRDRDTAVGLRCIIVVALVLEYGDVGEYGETMGETARNEELQMVVLGKLYGDVLSVGRRTFAYVDGNIQHSAFDAADQFRLGERRQLKMKSAHYTFRGARLVVLHEIDGTDLFVELLLRIALEEVSARIGEDARLDDDYAVYIGLDYIHGLVDIGRIGTVEFFNDFQQVLPVLVLEHRAGELGHFIP